MLDIGYAPRWILDWFMVHSLDRSRRTFHPDSEFRISNKQPAI